MKQGLEFVNTGAVLICTNGVVPAFFRSNPEPHVFLAALDHGSADDKIFKNNIGSFVGCKSTRKACTGVFDEWDLTFDPKINNHKSLCYDSCIGCLIGGGTIGFATHGQVHVSLGSVIALRSTAKGILPNANPLTFDTLFSPIIATTKALVTLLADTQHVNSEGASIDSVDIKENIAEFANLNPTSEWFALKNEGRRIQLAEWFGKNDPSNDSEARPYKFGSSNGAKSTREKLAAIDKKVILRIKSWSKSTAGEWTYLSEQFEAAGGRVELTVVGVEAKATADANIEGLLNAKAGGRLLIEGYVFKADFDAEYELGDVDIKAQAELQFMAAAFDAGGYVIFEPANGVIKINVEGEASVVILGPNGEVSVEYNGVEVGVEGGVGLGFGGKAGASLGWDDWKFTFDAKLGAWIGVGGFIEPGVSIDIKEVVDNSKNFITFPYIDVFPLIVK